MLYFVQQFGRDGLSIEEYRPKCCTFYNIEPRVSVIALFLLYKLQHLLSLLQIAPVPRPNFHHLMVPRQRLSRIDIRQNRESKEERTASPSSLRALYAGTVVRVESCCKCRNRAGRACGESARFAA